MSTISSIDARLFNVPLSEVLRDAKHGDHTHFELITATITLDGGETGTGYTYTGGRGGQAVLAMIRHDLAPLLIGRDAHAVETLNAEMFWHVHYVGRGGVAAFAISALDIALWDLRGRARGEPLSRMAGGASDRCRAYCGGIDLGFSRPRLLDSVRGYLARGVDGVKIKVGLPDLAEDVARVAAVRKLIGPDVALMVDANYAMTVDQAIAAAHAFAPHDLTWFEEPIDPDDLEGYTRIAEASPIPIAMGENLHIRAEFDRALRTASLGYLQPDAGNCGGITGWLQAADLAFAKGIPICSHGMQELNVSLVSGRENPGWIELHSFPIEDYTHQRVRIEGARALAPQTPGTGVSFDWEKLHRAHDTAR